VAALPTRLDQLQRWARRLQTNILTFVSSAACVVLGAFFCWLVAPTEFWPTFLLAVGAGVIAAGALGLVSQLVVQRSVQREFLQAASLSSELAEAGLDRLLTTTKQYESEFTRLLSTASVVDLSFVDNSRWLLQHEDALRSLLKGKGRIRVMLPSEADTATMNELFKRFKDTDRDRFRTRVKMTRQVLQSLAQDFPPEFGHDGTTFKSGLWLKNLDVAPTYSYYRIDKTALLRVFETQKEETPTHPVLVLRAGGNLWKFVTGDFNSTFTAAPASEQPAVVGSTTDEPSTDEPPADEPPADEPPADAVQA